MCKRPLAHFPVGETGIIPYQPRNVTKGNVIRNDFQRNLVRLIAFFSMTIRKAKYFVQGLTVGNIFV